MRLNTAKLDALHAAALSAEDSNSGFRCFQKRGEIFADGFVRAIFDRGCLYSHFECSVDNASDFVAARARLHANLKSHGSVAGNDVELLPSG